MGQELKFGINKMKAKQFPKGWKEVELGEVCEISAGGTPRRDKNEYWKEGTISWLKISDMKEKYISETEEMITKEGLNNSSAKLFPTGTLVYSIFATLGAIGILGKESSTNQAIAGIIPKKNFILIEYLYYCLISQKREILSKKSHATQDNLNLTVLRSFKIPLPPLSIQKQIVSILEKAEALKQKREEADKLTEDYLKSVFYEMFYNKRFEKSLIRTGIVKTENKNPKKDFPERLFKYIDIASIDSFSKKIVETKEIMGKDAPSRAKQLIKFKDILVSTVRPNLNSVALVPNELSNQICSTGFCVLRADDKNFLSEYLFFIVKSDYFVNELVKKCKGANYPAVSSNDILDLKIPLPPLSLQQKFASIVEQVEKLKEKQKKSKKEIDDLFDSLMQNAFNGELVR